MKRSRRNFAKQALIGAAALIGGRITHSMEVADYVRLGLDKRYPIDQQVNGRSNMELIDALNVPGDAQYHPCAEAYPAADVPPGKIISITDWNDAHAYPNTYRDMALYIPDRSDIESKNLPVMVFNDGLGYSDPQGPVRANKVLDTLTHNRDIPAMAAIFVMPGRVSPRTGNRSAQDADPRDRDQRSFEYDSVTPLYGEFLTREILPFAASQLEVTFSQAAADRAICGISSGGICAFNAAWHHPTAFSRVLSHCGSFVNIRGGHNYPYLVRSTAKKGLRVYLTSGEKDGNIILGNWPLANQQMASALEYAGYQYHFEFGRGGHSLRHGGALFAQSMRWLWQ